jgi:hypothetical protein
MSAEVVPGTGPAPRRARHLIPAELPRRGEVIAACVVLALLGHLLVAQLTFILAVVFVAVSKTSRWRLSWLLVPAAVGLAWTVAIGPRAAAAGFTAGPAAILGYLSGGGHPFAHLLHPHGAFVGAGSWLPRQFPIALIAAAAEAAVVGWLDWMHTDEWAVPPRRPGAVAVARAAAARRAIRAGAMLTRDGFALGVAPGTGARVLLSWPEVDGGVLVTGAVAQEITVTSLQVVHAALRRRKPVIAVDLSGDAAVAGAVTAACRATGTPLQVFGTAGEGHYEPFRHADPARRLTMTLALLPGTTPGVRSYLSAVFELIDEVPADARTPVLDDVRHLLNPLALRTRLGLVAAESPRRDHLARLVGAAARTAQAAPEPLLATARRIDAVRASPAGRWLSPAPDEIELARVVRQRSAVVFSADATDVARLACADIAALGEDLRKLGVDGDGLVWLHGWSLPARALTGLLSDGPAAGLPVLVTTTSPAIAADLADQVNAVVAHRLANAATAARVAARTGTRLVPASLDAGQAEEAGRPAWPAELVPRPAVPPRALLSLGPGQFVLTVAAPRRRLVELGQAVRARLPRGAGS